MLNSRFKTVWRGEAQKYEQTCLFGKFVRKKWSIDVWLVFSGDGRTRTFPPNPSRHICNALLLSIHFHTKVFEIT